MRITCCLLLALVPAWAVGQEPATKESAPVPVFDFSGAAKMYTVSTGAHDDECQPHQVDLLKWSNPERATIAGSVFLWTLEGLPQAACCMYAYRDKETFAVDHELVSLSTERIESRYEREAVWRTEKPGVVWKAVANAPIPAARRSARLAQMRTLAALFTGHLGTAAERTHELRLLTQPIYRYPDSPAVDGGVFAYVQTTDPEILLLLRANLKEKQPVWEFAAARMTVVHCLLMQGDKIVWSVPWGQNGRDEPYHTRGRVAWTAVERRGQSQP